MISKTKYKIDDDTVKKLFAEAGIFDVTEIAPLGAGEYNTVLAVTAGGKEYAIKIAPDDNAPILSHEKDMMASEIFWYGKMKEFTDIRTPEIYYYSTDRRVIPTSYFIMEKLKGRQLGTYEVAGESANATTVKLSEMAAKIHKIKNDEFGYIQNGLHKSWYEAISAMVQMLISDCEKKGKNPKNGKKLLGYIEKYKSILLDVECCMVNFDIWNPNCLIMETENGKSELAWIDPERSFWGDRIADFVCLETMKTLQDKKVSMDAYNKVSDVKITAGREEKIRYAVMVGYLGFLMGTEKYYRYNPFLFGWWRNVGASKFYLSLAFKILKNEG